MAQHSILLRMSELLFFTTFLNLTQYAQSVSATYQTGADVDVRAQFVTNGKLANTLDTNFRAISNNWPVFGLAHDLGSVTTASTPVVFSVGHVRNPALEYIVAGGALQNRNLYFMNEFSTTAAVVRCIFVSALPHINANICG